MQFVQLDTFAAENFDSLVAIRSTRLKIEKQQDKYSSFVVEIVTHYRGNKVIGYQERNRCGYRYYLRKD